MMTLNEKAIFVVDSCTNLEQVFVARRFLRLVRKRKIYEEGGTNFNIDDMSKFLNDRLNVKRDEIFHILSNNAY